VQATPDCACLFFRDRTVSAMRTILQFTTFLVIASCGAGEIRFYPRLSSLIDPNGPLTGITSPLLTETNNTAAKVVNATAILPQIKRSGEIAGIRLGMTAEEVVARWGRPRWIWSRCYGGPRLCYSGASIVLEPTANSVKTILLEMGSGDTRGRSHPFTVSQSLTAFGEPTSRK